MIQGFLYNPKSLNEHAHSASLCEHNDHIYCSWYVYPDREHIGGKVVISKFNSRKCEWSEAKVITELSGNFGNPVLFSYQGQLTVYYVKINSYWDDAKIYTKTCTDLEKLEWSSPFEVNTPEGIMIRHRPIILDNKVLIPAYDEKSMMSIIYQIHSHNNWREYSKIDGHFIQGDIVKTNASELQIFLRAAKDNKNVFRSISSDLGKSWNTIIKTNLPCPLSGIAATSFSDGMIGICFNHTFKHQRTPLSFNASLNSGVNFFDSSFHLEQTDTELSYPSMLVDTKNNLHIVYTFGRKKIKHILTDQREILKNIENCNA